MKTLLKLNLLIIQQSPDWGGAEEWMANLVSTWSKQGIPITAYTNFAKLQSAWKRVGATTNNIPFTLDIIGNFRGLIKSLFLLPFAILWYSHKLLSAKGQGVNLILMSGFSEKLLVSWLASTMGLKVVWFEYGPLAEVFKKNFYFPKLIYRLSGHIPQAVFTISEHSKASLITDASISLRKIKVIYPGVSIPVKTDRTSRPIVGHLSRICVEKGQRLLLKSWPKVLKKVPQAKLKIAGTGPDERYLKNLVEKLGITKNVEFLGFIKDKLKFYRSLNVFVFPSIWEMEGFGLVMAEALSFGVPVLAFKTGANPEIITSNVGALVDKNISSLTNTIVNVLKDKKKHQDMSGDAKSRAKKLFNLKNQSGKILTHLNYVLRA